MKKAQRTEIIAGVWIVSRHGIDAELRKMRRAVEGMPPHLRAEIMEFFCDSKSGTHGIQLRTPGAAEPIASFLVPLRSAHIAFDYGSRRVLEISGWN